MYLLDRLRVRPILITELGYSPEKADLFLDHFPLLSDQLVEAVEVWLEDRKILDVKVEDISIRQVMELHNCNFLNAVRGLNELLSLPLSAEDRESLKRFYSTRMRQV